MNNKTNQNAEYIFLNELKKSLEITKTGRDVDYTEIIDFISAASDVDDSFKENILSKIHESLDTPFFLQKYKEDEIREMLSRHPHIKNQIAIENRTVSGIFEHFTNLYSQLINDDNYTQLEALSKALSLDTIVFDEKCMATLCLCDFLFYSFFYSTNDATEIKIYNSRLFKNPKDTGFTFDIDKLQMSPFEYHEIKKIVSSKSKELDKNGFILIPSETFWEESSTNMQDTLVCIANSAPKFFNQTLPEINASFNEKTYIFQLPWLQKIYLKGNDLKEGQTKSFYSTIDAERTNQKGKKSELFYITTTCAHPVLTLNLVINYKRLKNVFNHLFDKKQTQKHHVLETYELYRNFCQNSVISNNEYFDAFTKYSDALSFDCPVEESDSRIDSESDSISKQPLLINMLFAEELTCYNLIANYFCLFSKIYESVLIYSDIFETVLAQIPITSIISDEKDEFRKIYNETLTATEKLFFDILKAFIATHMIILDSPAQRIISSYTLSKQEIPSNPKESLKYLVYQVLKIIVPQKVAPISNAAFFKEASCLFHHVATENKIIDSTISEISPSFFETSQKFTDKEKSAYLNGFAEFVAMQAPKRLSKDYSLYSLLNSPKPENDPRLQKLGRKKQKKSGERNFDNSVPEKFDILYQGIRYYVLENNSFRKNAETVISNIFKKMQHTLSKIKDL
ncbi:MAG: hypothetical protein SO170_06025 [Butyribacter sp.]|nr:hypothetical protein [bacterium]MDY3854496.1 hypothetical protein [Butyribacter sp.]